MYPPAGVYVQRPVAAQATVPCAAVGAGVVTVRVSPFGSVSFASTFRDPAAFVAVPSVSSTALGEKIAAPPTPANAKTNVFGVPRVGPPGVLGCPSENTSAPTALTAVS